MAEENGEGRADELFAKNLAKGKFGGKAQYRILTDSPQGGVEAKYFQILRALTDKEPFGRSLGDEQGYIIKTKDIYSAGETSSYWGSVEQRKGIQIDKFQQIMQNIGGMIKAMFQLLRELRILEERLTFYEDSNKGDKHAEVHLKSVWVDQVEGGIQNATSVMGLTQKVGFAALADLFYGIHPKTDKDVESEVNKLKQSHGINKKVREVLGRKLKQFLVWKKKTYQELSTGQKFKLGYLRQHYAVIRLYLNWLRPYLKNIKRLQMRTEGVATDKDLVAAFETSKIDLEFLAVRTNYMKETPRGKIFAEFQEYFPIVRVRINFVAIPNMAYQEEGQRGAVHSGRMEMIVEGAVLSKKQLEDYQKALNQDDLDLLAMVDSSIEALRDELTYYLEKAGGAFDMRKKEETPKKQDIREGVLGPFIALGDFFKELTGVNFGEKKYKPSKSEKKAAEGMAKTDAYLGYYIFKKMNQMFTE